MARQILALLAVVALLVSSATGFDTYWHSQCSQKVGEQFSFTEDAWKIMQLGNFSPDFFGPVSEYASKNPQRPELDALNRYPANNPQVRGAAIFFHFDNLNSDLHSNADFDYLFSHLLQSTQNLLASYNRLLRSPRLPSLSLQANILRKQCFSIEYTECPLFLHSPGPIL